MQKQEVSKAATLFKKAYAALKTWQLLVYVDTCPALSDCAIPAGIIEDELWHGRWTRNFKDCIRSLTPPVSFRDLLSDRSGVSDKESLIVFALGVADRILDVNDVSAADDYDVVEAVAADEAAAAEAASYEN